MTWLGDQLGRIADEMPERDLGDRALEIHQRRRRNFMALATAAVVVVTVLAATVGVRAFNTEPPAAARPAKPPELSTIKVGLVPTVESAPVFVAVANHYFEEEGLTVEPVIVTGPAAAVPQVESGALDLAQSDYTTVFRLNELGREFKIVSSLYESGQGSFAIVVNDRSKIRTAAGLKRKKIAIPNLGVLQQVVLNGALKRAGLAPDDVLLVEKPYPEMYNALRAGQVDAALLAEPYVTHARDTGRVRIVEDAMTGEFANLYTAGVTATGEWIRRNPRTLAAFQRALAKAQRLIAGDPQQVRDAVPTYTKISREVTTEIALGAYPAEPDLKELQRVADLALSYKLIKRPADLGSAVVKGG